MSLRHQIVSLLVSLLTACSAAPTTAEAEAYLDVSAAGNSASVLLDDFEAAPARWTTERTTSILQRNTSRVSTATLHATRGKRSLQLSYDAAAGARVLFYTNHRVNLSDAAALAFDLYNPSGAASDVAIAFNTSGTSRWQESAAQPLKPGANAIQMDLAGATFMTPETGGQASARLNRPEAVRQIAIVVYTQKAGSVYVDKLVALRASKPAPGVVAAGARVSIRPRQASVPQYGLMEFDINTPVTAQNPHDPAQIAIDVTLTAPSGKQITVPAYYTQDFRPGTREPVWPQMWRARFTPSEEGVWKVRATVTAPQTRSSSAVASFSVTPGVSRGFVHVDAANPRYLRFENGEAYFPIGVNLGWGHAEPLQDFERWFDALQRNGGNVARIWMASWSFGIEWNDSGLGNYRLDRAWLLDEVLHMAEQRGIYIILVLINHGAFNTRYNAEWDSNPYNAALGGPCATPADFATNEEARQLFKQRLRYIAARWAYSPNLLAWEWWNEVDLTPLGEPNLLRPWLSEMTAYLRTVDPYQHLTTNSYANTADPRITNIPEIDLLQRHEYNQQDPRVTMPKGFAQMTDFGSDRPIKPVLYGEFGAATNSESPTRFDPDGMHFQNGLWASAFSGYASTALYWWWDNYIDAENYWGHLKGVSELFSREDISQYRIGAAQVNTTTVQASALITADRALIWLRNAQYSVEAAQWQYQQDTLFGSVKDADWTLRLAERRGATVTLEAMQSGEYRVIWLDARTGTQVSSNTAYARNGRLVLSAPTFTRDVAARVVR